MPPSIAGERFSMGENDSAFRGEDNFKPVVDELADVSPIIINVDSTLEPAEKLRELLRDKYADSAEDETKVNKFLIFKKSGDFHILVYEVKQGEKGDTGHQDSKVQKAVSSSSGFPMLIATGAMIIGEQDITLMRSRDTQSFSENSEADKVVKRVCSNLGLVNRFN
jgi:hypothetical protein